MKRFLSISLAVLMVFLVACGGNDAKKDEKKADVQELRQVFDAEPQTLDSSRSSDGYSAQIFGAVYDALVTVDVAKDGKETIVPAGAESWKVSDDKKVYTFKIRKHEWSDGKPVTAEDYRYSILRTLNPETAAPYALLLHSIKGAQAYNAKKADASTVGVTCPDKMTLKIELEKPIPYFLQLCYFKTMIPLRKDIIEKYGEKYGSDAKQIVGNGAFTIEKWVHNSEISLKKNPKYWDKKNIKLDKVNLKIIKSDETVNQMLDSKQLDMAGVNKPEWVNKFKAKKLIQIQKYLLGTNYLFFNTKDPLFKNDKVRLAFSLAADREKLNKVVFKNKFEPAYGFVSKGIHLGEVEYTKEVPGALSALKDQDPKKLLQEGLKELGMNTDPSKLDVTYFTSGQGSSFIKEYTDFLLDMYKEKLGVTLKMKIVDWPTFSKGTDKGDYQFAGMAWTGDYDDPSTFLDIFVSDAGMINTGWKNDEYDKLVRGATSEQDPKKRLEMYKKAEKILLEKAPIAPTLFRKSNTFVWPYVKEFRPSVLAPYNYKNVYIKK